MQLKIFEGIFDSDLVNTITVTQFLLCICVALFVGLFLALAYSYKATSSKSFVVTLATLPVVVCVVIMMVNGNMGTGVAVAGTFSLVRFRSVPGTAKEIGAIFIAMGAGLMLGMGYLGYGVLFTVFVSLANLLYAAVAVIKRSRPSGESRPFLGIVNYFALPVCTANAMTEFLLHNYLRLYKLRLRKTVLYCYILVFFGRFARCKAACCTAQACL